MVSEQTQAIQPKEESAVVGEIFDPAERDLSLVEMLVVVMRHKRMVFGTTILTAALATAIAFLIPERFTATTTLMPPQQPQSIAASLAAQVGAAGGVLGDLAGKNLGLKNPNDLYAAMIKSRVVADSLIRKFHLQTLYEKKTLVDTRKRLASESDITAGREGLISISVEDKDRSRAADMANAYVDELRKLMASLVVTEAGQRRLFFEQQFLKSKDDLAAAEVALKQSQQSSGLIELNDQAKAIIESVASLKAQIAAKEVQLQAIHSFATDQNPEVLLVRQELAGLQDQLTKLETRQNGGHGDIQIATRDVPQAGLDYIRRLRDVRYYEYIFELLAKQLEAAKLDEAREGAVVQVVDPATPPDKKSFPPRALLIAGLSALALFGSVWVAFLMEGMARGQADPRHQQQVALLKRLVRGI